MAQPVMRVYFETTTGKLISQPLLYDVISQFEFKRADAAKFEIQFLENGVPFLLGGVPDIRFALKEEGKFDGDSLVFTDDFTAPGDASGFYAAYPDFNTVDLNALLGHDGAGEDTSDDVAYVDAIAELTYSTDGLAWTSSPTIPARVFNDVIKGDEGVPVGGDPVYPGAQDVWGVVGASIASKAAAYALTGVAVGTVYKTDDTGQVMEFIGTDETSVYDWKMDGVILVDDNDEKQLLTNLPDGQQVEVVGEGGRIERYNGDNAGSVTPFTISDAGSPEAASSQTLAKTFTWHEGDGVYYEVDQDGYVEYSGTRWEIKWQGSTIFRADLSASSVMPWEATGWTPFDGGGGAGTGTIADGGITALPEAAESNWSDIVGTYEVIFDIQPAMGGAQPIFDGMTLADGIESIGWYRSGTYSKTMDVSFYGTIMEIDGVAQNFVPSETAPQSNADAGHIILPVLPKVRSIQIQQGR